MWCGLIPAIRRNRLLTCVVILAVVLLSLSHGYSCEWPPQDESTEFADKRLLHPRVLLD